MKNSNFLEEDSKNLKTKQITKDVNKQKSVANNTNKILFDYDQLNYLRYKFTLNFEDGFMFGLGMIIAFILVSLVVTVIMASLGVLFIKTLF